LLFVGVVAAMTWPEFKTMYNKVYDSNEIEATRAAIFAKNMEFINEHNSLQSSYSVGMNEFGDLTVAEFSAQTANPNGFSDSVYDGPALSDNSAALPPSADWRTSGCVGPVIDQGQCGAAWALVTRRLVEVYNCLKHQHSLVTLSLQDLLDCTPGSMGCNGGTIPGGLQYCVDSGLDSEASYPYTGTAGPCRHKNDTVAAKCQKFNRITPPGNETALTEVLAYQGPVACAIDASESSFQFYTGGIYSDPKCSARSLDHVVLNVGYGTSSGQDFYILQNSWGTSWGQKGYIFMARNKHNMCGVASDAYWVTVE